MHAPTQMMSLYCSPCILNKSCRWQPSAADHNAPHVFDGFPCTHACTCMHARRARMHACTLKLEGFNACAAEFSYVYQSCRPTPYRVRSIDITSQTGEETLIHYNSTRQSGRTSKKHMREKSENCASMCQQLKSGSS